VLAIPCCETAVATAPPASVVPAATGRPDVLVAEDDRFTSLVVRRILEAQGLQCDAAATGEEAVALVRERRPRVLLLDVGLPVADGFDVVAQLQEEGYRTLPLVVYTGRDLTPDERARLHLGETRYLVKSRASEEELATTVSHLLEHAALEAAG
jgi:CheY-like chemotaxis protein